MKKNSLIILSIFAIALALSAISCGDNKDEEVSEKQDVILGRWVMVYVKALSNSALTNDLEKTLDFVNFTQTISSTNTTTGISDREIKTYSSFEEMANDLRLTGFIFEKTGFCRPIIYSNSGWIDSGESFMYEVQNNTVYKIDDNNKSVLGTITFQGNSPQLNVETVLDINTYRARQERIYIKF